MGWCAANGAAFVPFSPLGRGFLTGAVTKAAFEKGDFRGRLPRFQEGVLEQNLRIVDVVRAVAERRGVTPAQVAIAWTLAQGEHGAGLVGGEVIVDGAGVVHAGPAGGGPVVVASSSSSSGGGGGGSTGSDPIPTQHSKRPRQLDKQT